MQLSLQETHIHPVSLTSGIIPEQISLANKIRVGKKKKRVLEILDKLSSVNKLALLCNSQVLNKDGSAAYSHRSELESRKVTIHLCLV